MMIVGQEYVSCPKCGWEPSKGDIWQCDVFRTRWNTFETHGTCPGCGKQFIDTQCGGRKGGCGQMSVNADWYKPLEENRAVKEKKFTWFWQQKEEPPITESDRIWVENELLWLAEFFTPEVFRSLVTITPDLQYFDRNFSGTEEDADYILQKVAEIMYIKPWEIQLMFFSEEPTRFSGNIIATPSEKIKGSWIPRSSELVDKGFGNKEIWIDLRQLADPVELIATMSVELAEYKLISEYAVNEDIRLLSDVTSLVFGFGIFRGNAYFKINNRYIQKRGGLPEPIIAYVMAWLAHYRNEDISWKQYLNRTVRKYFDKSYKYIQDNKDSIKWTLDPTD